MGMKKGDSFITGPPFEILVAVVFAFLILGFIIVQSGGLKILLDMICENVPELCYGVPERENVLIARDNWNVLGCTVNAMLTDKIPESDTKCASYVRGVEPPGGGGGGGSGETAGIVGRMVSLPALGPLSLPVLGFEILGMQFYEGGKESEIEAPTIRAGEAMISCTEETKEVKKKLTFALPEGKALGCRCEADILYKIGGGTKFEKEIQGLSILEVADNCLTNVSEYVNDLRTRIEIAGDPDPSLHNCSEVDLDTGLKDKISGYDKNIQSLEMERCFCEQRLEGSFGKIGYPVYGLTEEDISAACYADYEALKQEAEKGKPFEPLIEPKVMSCGDDPEDGDFYAWSTPKEVTVTEKELKCMVENFYLPEDFGGDIFAGIKEKINYYLDGFGDPYFLVYAHYFPLGEASDWEEESSWFKGWGKWIMAGMCILRGSFFLGKTTKMLTTAKGLGELSKEFKVISSYGTKVKSFFKKMFKSGGKDISSISAPKAIKDLDELVDDIVDNAVIVPGLSKPNYIEAVAKINAQKEAAQMFETFEQYKSAVRQVISGEEERVLREGWRLLKDGKYPADVTKLKLAEGLGTTEQGKTLLKRLTGQDGSKLESMAQAARLTMAGARTGTLVGINSYAAYYSARLDSQLCKYDQERHSGNLVFKVPYDENCGEEFPLGDKVISAPSSPDPEKDNIVDIATPIILYRKNPTPIIPDEFVPFYLASPCYANLTLENREAVCEVYMQDVREDGKILTYCDSPKKTGIFSTNKKCGHVKRITSKELVEKSKDIVLNGFENVKLMGDKETINIEGVDEEFLVVTDPINEIKIYLKSFPEKKAGGDKYPGEILEYKSYYKKIGSADEPIEFDQENAYAGIPTKHVFAHLRAINTDRDNEIDILEAGEDGIFGYMQIRMSVIPDLKSDFMDMYIYWHIDETGTPDRVYRIKYSEFPVVGNFLEIQDSNENLAIDHLGLYETGVSGDIVGLSGIGLKELSLFSDKDFDGKADSVTTTNCVVDSVVVSVDKNKVNEGEHNYCYKSKEGRGTFETAVIVAGYGLSSVAKYTIGAGSWVGYAVSVAVDCGIAALEFFVFKGSEWPGKKY